MKRLFWLSLILFTTGISWAQKAPSRKEYRKTFTTYPFSDPNPVPSFSKIYPYFRFDGYTNKPVSKEWKVVELENDYIRVMILPEIGGKIWTAIEKSTNQPFIYYNHVVKFRDVAMRGPWTSGGLEANYGIIGHTPNCATPVDYTVRTNADSSVSCIIGVLDLLTRTQWRMEINLEKDKAYFTTHSFWYNTTSLAQPYYHWMNTGIKAAGDLEFIYPGTKYLGHEGEYADWPINKSNGKNISFYEQNNFGRYKSYHVFGKYADFFGGYWHHDDFGMVRYAPHDDKAGKKIWIWGLSRQGMIWEKLLTDTDGQYVEVQSGRLFNQNAEKSTRTPFKHTSFAPYATDTWTEYWYPVMKTKGFVAANAYGALNVKAENGWLKVYFSPAQKIHDKLLITTGGKTVYSKSLQLAPLEHFVDSVKVTVTPETLMAVLGDNKLIWNADPAAGVLDRPVDAPKDFDWQSTYGLYLEGREFSDQKLYGQAALKLAEALQKDPNYLPALVKMAELKYRSMLYAEAVALAKHALSIDTHDGGANYYYGLACAQLGDHTNAKDGFDLAALSAEYRSAAYTELSRLYMLENDVDKGISYAQKAIDYNRYNIAALQLLATGYHNRNDEEKAMQVLQTLLSYDPLNCFAKAESFFWHPAAGNPLQDIVLNEQPQETYLEIAATYFNMGRFREAKVVLAWSPPSPMVYYWLAWLAYKEGNEEYKTLLDKANNSSPLLVFPFRAEMAGVFQWAAQQSGSWKPKYYLALIYKDKERQEESKDLFSQVKDIPDFAPFYAARAALIEDSTDTDLQHALSLDKDEWRYHKLLAESYILRQQYGKALAITEAYYRGHPQHYIMGMLYAKTLLLNQRYADGDALLTSINIIPFEGATDGRELYREAKLMQALQEMQQKNYKKALSFISEAKLWGENLGVGKPYDEDIDVRLEDWMNYICFKQMKQEGKAAASLQQIIRFQPSIDNTVSNFLPANHLVSAWAMNEMQQHEKAVQWLEEQIRQYPDMKVLLWSKAVFERLPAPVVNSDASIRLLEKLMTVPES